MNSKSIKGVNIKTQVFNIGGKKRENLQGLGVEKDFLDNTSKAQALKENRHTSDLIEIKNICTSGDTIEKTKDQPWTGRKDLQVTFVVKDLYLKI